MRVTCPHCGSDRLYEINRVETRYPILSWETRENGEPTPSDYDAPTTLDETAERLSAPFDCAECNAMEMTFDDLRVNGTRHPDSGAARSTYLTARTDMEPAELHNHQGEQVAFMVEGSDPEATARLARLLADAPRLLLLLHRLHVFTQPFIAQAAEHCEPDVMLAVRALDDAALTLRDHGVQL